MSTAQGSIAIVNSKLTATILIDSIPFTYATTIAVSLPDFQAVATLTYNHKNDLTGAQSYNGKVGENTFELTLTNGPKITGPLTPPIIPAKAINGSGLWTQG
ncbi:hypothetical protein BDW22DRAFT_1485979 [Trametopsis cervina]|nr:hypothetical protein BDW22DRAFT_1485979 [Trametopsis cervina]